MDAPLLFLADAMLGRLARWLRTMGYDTFYDAAADDARLVQIADFEGRVLLTRDRHLVEHLRPKRAMLIRSTSPLDQLREVVDECAMERPTGFFTRCMVCNAKLCDATIDEVGSLPEDTREGSGPFRRCPSCERLYWPGSHTRRMLGVLRDRFPEWML